MNRKIGRYLLIEPIAAGGMGTIYLAQLLAEGGIRRPAAVKRIKPALAALEPIRAMFLDEARVLSRLRHPNVCGILDYGESEGLPYIAMEWLAGAPLSQIAEQAWHREVLEPWVIAFVLARAARGLHAAHELRDEEGAPLHVIHRDVSPSNIHVLFTGEVKVLDFGIAFSRGRFAEPTDHGQIKGKYRYMAPEYVRREPIDRRADLWALGVILWESLCGLPLFEGVTQAEVLKKILRAEIPPLEAHLPDAPPALQAVLERALERDVERRYATALELAEALEAYLASLEERTDEPRLEAWLRAHFPELEEAEEKMLLEARQIAKRFDAGEEGAGELPTPPPVPFEPFEHPLAAPPRESSEEEVPVTTQPARPSVRISRAPQEPPRRSRLDGPVMLYAVGATLLALGLLARPLWSSSPSERDDDATEAPSESRPQSEGSSAPDGPVEESSDDLEDGLEDGFEDDARLALTRPFGWPQAREARAPKDEEEEEEEAVEEALRSGRVNLLAVPTAEVQWRGRSLGRTPIAGRHLPPGQHRLRLRWADGRERDLWVRVRPGRLTRVGGIRP